MTPAGNLVGLWCKSPDGSIGKITYEVAEDIFLVEWHDVVEDDPDAEDDTLYRGAMQGPWRFSRERSDIE